MPDTRIDDDVYRKIRLFQGVPQETVAHVIADCPVRELPEGTSLLAPGQESRELFILLSGAMRIHLDSLATPELGRLEPGGCVGEMAFIEGEMASGFVVADRPCSLLALDRDELWRLINLSHQVSRNLLLMLSRRASFTGEEENSDEGGPSVLEHYARVDPLTGLYNRRWLDDALPRQLHRCERNQQPLCLILIDADNFTEFNENHGHLAGDFALITLAQTLSEALRPGDFAARFGGQEFAVALPNTGIREAEATARRVCEAIREADVLTGEGLLLPPVKVSAGLAEARPGEEAGVLVAAAHAAMKQAKNTGRDQVRTAE